jgi:hypothetical protein
VWTSDGTKSSCQLLHRSTQAHRGSTTEGANGSNTYRQSLRPSTLRLHTRARIR